MPRPFAGLSAATLRWLAASMEGGSLSLPVHADALGPRMSPSVADAACEELNARGATLGGARGLALVLRLLAEEREDAAESRAAAAELVWTGPDTRGAASRDTWVVAREPFAIARRRVLLSCFTFHAGREILRPLAERMDASPDLVVRLFVDVGRKPRDRRSDAELLREFADFFRREQWPTSRMPEVFHDPRSLDPGRGLRSSLHAKCIVIDEEVALVTSANISEAAHERNIEAGILVRDASIAGALSQHFESLVSAGHLRRVPGL